MIASTSFCLRDTCFNEFLRLFYVTDDTIICCKFLYSETEGINALKIKAIKMQFSNPAIFTHCPCLSYCIEIYYHILFAAMNQYFVRGKMFSLIHYMANNDRLLAILDAVLNTQKIHKELS